MFYLIGTSHIAKESFNKVKDMIESVKPDCVAVELDLNRFIALQQQKRGKIKLPLFQKIIILLLQKIQDKLAKETGIFAGQEMLEAIKYGRENHSDIVFIDQNINITISRLMNKLGFIEKTKLFFMLIFGFFGIPFWHKRINQIDLNKIPDEEFIDFAVQELKQNFPTIYNVLVKERDEYMARQLKFLGEKYNSIIAVVGAGHVKGIKRILNKYNNLKSLNSNYNS